MRVLYLAAKDLRLLRDPKMAALALAMPLAFTLLFGILMGGGGSGTPALVAVAWVDQDGGEASASLAGLLRDSNAVGLQPMTEAAAENALARSRVAAAVVVPSGFGLALQEGRQSQVRLLVADANAAGAQVARNVVQSATSRLAAAAQAAAVSKQAAEAWEPFGDEREAAAYFRAGLAKAGELWTVPALSLDLRAAQAQETRTPGGFAQSSPGMLVQFTIFNITGGAVALVLERQSGALRRLLTTPMTRSGIIVGKTLAIFLIVLLQQLILVSVGQAAFGVDYFSSPLATAAMVFSFAFCVAALGLLVGTLARSEEAATSATLVLMFVLSGVGGAWFPLDVTGPAFAAVGHLLPSAWAMDGFHSILLRGSGLQGVLLPVAVLLGYGLAFLGAAIWRFRFE